MTEPDAFPLQPLAGLWQLVRAEFDGERAHELVTSNTTLRLDTSGYEVRFGGEIADRGTLMPGSGGAWPVLIFSGVSGTNAGRTIRSIYQLRGNSLRICHGLAGVAPDAFTTAEGSHRYLATYRRVG